MSRVETVLLLKAVLPLEEMAWDPQRRTGIRNGSLRANPFDLRALGAALRLRQPGESVTVLSIGPEAAAPALAAALRAGADRAIRIGDDALAGSDLLITARVLARAIGRLPADLILVGKASTDSGTAALGPELAGLLDLPLYGPARSILRPSSGTADLELLAEGDPTPFRFAAPAVVTIGEKVGRPARPAEAADPGRSPELWDLATLGLRPEEVGLAASPTVVGAIGAAARSRTVRRLTDPDPARCATEAARAIATALADRGRSLRGASDRAPPAPTPVDLLVLASDAVGRIDPTALEILAVIGRQHSRGIAVVVGVRDPGAARAALGSVGAVDVRSVPAAADARTGAAAVADHLLEILSSAPNVEAVLLPASEFGGQVAGRLAARRGVALITGAIGLDPSDTPWAWTKPSFGRDRLATVRARARPYVVTVRAGAFAAAAPGGVPPGGPPGGAEPQRPGPTTPNGAEPPDRPGFGDLDRARVVVVVGSGVGGAAEIERLAALVAPWSAALAATRRVVDAGLLPAELQVGLTGRSLAPELVLLVGVSGSVHHLSGWLRAGVVAAINPDPEAPVFGRVDVGLVGRWEELLPELVRAFGPLGPLGGR
ncbi:MAG: FAD-binding protein [Thermoplasmata archaeon]